MKFRFVILSVACFSCLIPSAVSFNLLAAKAVAGEAAEDIATIGAQTLAAKKAAVAKAAEDIVNIAADTAARKGEVLKTAASSIAGAWIKAATSIGATILKAGFNLVTSKFTKPVIEFDPTVVVQQPLLEKTVVEPLIQVPEVVYQQEYAVPASSVSEDYRPAAQLAPIWSTLPEKVEVQSPYRYKYVDYPRVRYTRPLVETHGRRPSIPTSIHKMETYRRRPSIRY